MKKLILLITLLMFSISVGACSLFKIVIDKTEKEEIVLKKYGEIEYVSNDIIIYKNLSDKFDHIKGIDYILKNSGNRGSISPELAENFYLIANIVKQGSEYKILVFNNILKKNTDKSKAFILTDYFFPIEINKALELLNNHDIKQDIRKMNIIFTKKDSTLEGNFETSDIALSYYNYAYENEIYMSFYDYQTGNILIGDQDSVILGNVREKILYEPSYLNYEDYVNPSNYLNNHESASIIRDNVFGFNLNFDNQKGYKENAILVTSKEDYDLLVKNYITNTDHYIKDDIDSLIQSFQDKYSNNFFDTNNLIMFGIEEGSGSIDHIITDVVVEGNSVRIELVRLVPWLQTHDMAYYTSYIKIPKIDAQLAINTKSIFIQDRN